MRFALWLSRRLSLNRGGSRTGVIIAVVGVALALIVMEATLAIISGFKQEIERKLSGFDAQITVLPPFASNETSDSQSLAATPTLLSLIHENVDQAADIAIAIRQPGILKTDSDFEGVIFVAREPSSDFSFERNNIILGNWPAYQTDSCYNDIVISSYMASRLGLEIGDRIFSTFIIDGSVKLRRNRVAALYKSDFGEYDRQVVYCSLPLLQSILNFDSISGNRIEVRNIPDNRIDATGATLQQQLYISAAIGNINGYYPVSTIHQSGSMYFNWLALLDTNVVVIFILMLCVAALTLISSLFILILEHVRTIGILRAIGASKPDVRNIFVFMALKVVGIGMIIGNILGLGVLIVQKIWKFIPLNPDMYYLSSVPVNINPLAMILLNIGVAVSAWLILVLPASLASTISPSQAAKFD